MNEELKDDALTMLNIMVERIKTAAEDGAPNDDMITFRAAGANFMLYHLGILTSEEHADFDRRIFRPFD